MKTRLYFDTETTGKADFKQPDNYEVQPHIVQLGAIICDPSGREIGCLDTLIKPEGWTIPEETSGIHGITTEMCEAYGVPLIIALAMFSKLLEQSHELTAHNKTFDLIMMDASYHRCGRNWAGYLGAKETSCTMDLMTPVCKLPGRYGKPKWPSLSEAYKHCTGEELQNAHSALVDTRACKVIHNWYLNNIQTLV